ncbi:MAG: 16S rRNA (cytosine(967)-C(5))-methyltransferase RsmB [Candidatus Protistobacter heckmanni]|nr:16S rRNA (cytosine(967)-C(5))-methyltransferase RsmB [Candidatus Protistobacter heckmanni]
MTATPASPDSLSAALTGAAAAIGSLRKSGALPAAVAAAAVRAGPRANRGAIQDLAYLAARRLAWCDAVLAQLVERAPAPPVRDLLVCALALLGWREHGGEAAPSDAACYPDYAVVDQAVRAAESGRATRSAKGMVNGVLRNFLRRRAELDDQARLNEPARWNYPQWWIDTLRAAYPAQWQAILEAGKTHPPMTLRVNLARGDVPSYLVRLREAGLDAEPLGAQGLRLARPAPVDRLPGFAEGLVSVQDAGAQLAAPLLDADDGMRVLDACAAPGGKTGHVLELAGTARVVALDADAQRVRRIEENLARLQLQAEVRTGDAAEPSGWWDGEPFERILADVPCSASGIVRRHPDIRWLRRESDVAALRQTQRRILDALWPLLAPGGKLLYVTCSVFPQECEEKAAWFEGTRKDAVRLRTLGQLLPGTPAAYAAEGGAAPGSADHDGFFYALFQKRPLS